MDNQPPEENIVADLYDNYHETQKEIFVIEASKTRNAILYIASVMLIFNLISVIASDYRLADVILNITIIPVVIAGMALLAMKEPLLAMIIAGLIVIGLWVYIVVIIGPIGIVSGWLQKAILIYLLINGITHAKEAQRIKKELNRK